MLPKSGTAVESSMPGGLIKSTERPSGAQKFSVKESFRREF